MQHNDDYMLQCIKTECTVKLWSVTVRLTCINMIKTFTNILLVTALRYIVQSCNTYCKWPCLSYSSQTKHRTHTSRNKQSAQEGNDVKKYLDIPCILKYMSRFWVATCNWLQVAGRCVLLNLGTTIHLVFARHKFKPHAQLHDTQWSRLKLAQRGKKPDFPRFYILTRQEGSAFCPLYDLTTNWQDMKTITLQFLEPVFKFPLNSESGKNHEC